MSIRKILGILSAALTLVMASSIVQAEPPVTPPEYDIKFTPRIDVTGTHTDNILQATQGTRDSIINVLLSANLKLSKPDQTITSDIGVQTTQYLQYENEEVNDFYVSTGLLQNFSEALSLTASIRFDDSTLARRAITEGDADGRTDTKTLTGNIGSTYKINKQQYTISLNRVQFDLSDTEKLGTTVNKDDEDRVETNLTLKGSYMLNDVFQPSFTLSYGKINYQQKQDDFGNERSSSVIKFLFGGNLKLGSKVRVNGEGGYYVRDYEGVTFNTIEALIGDASIQVQVNESLSASGSYSRFFSEMNIDSTPGIFVDMFSAGLNYKASDKLSFNGSVSKMISIMELLKIAARDYSISAGCSYAFNETYSTSLQYTNTRRFSNDQVFVQDFTENTFVLKLSASF